MGPGGILLNWLSGIFLVCLGCYTLHLARRCRSARRRMVAAGIVLIALGIVPFLGTRSASSPRFARDVARSSAPVIAAIERYHTDHGEFPATLAELVPDYLESVPSLGYGGIRELQYFRASTPPRQIKTWADRRWDLWIRNSPYALVVERVPRGTIIFRPTGRYDDLPGGKRIPGTRWGATYED